MLNDFISHFEPLYYDNKKLKDHLRLKRSSDPASKHNVANNELELEFTAHNRYFSLKLKSDQSVFAPDVIFESTGKGIFHYDRHNALQGLLHGKHQFSSDFFAFLEA